MDGLAKNLLSEFVNRLRFSFALCGSLGQSGPSDGVALAADDLLAGRLLTRQI